MIIAIFAGLKAPDSSIVAHFTCGRIGALICSCPQPECEEKWLG
jgi:hypothetical protein